MARISGLTMLCMAVIAIAAISLSNSFASVSGTSATASNSVAPFGASKCTGRVLMPSQNFAFGEHIAFQFQIKNMGIRSFEYMSTEYFLDHFVIVQDAHGKTMPLTEEGMRWESMFGGRSRRGNIPIDIDPGAFFVDDPGRGLEELYNLHPGKYTIQIIFADNASNHPRMLNTPKLEFFIRKN